jgi:SET domain-containing protein
MLLVPTYVGPSRVEGVGLFAAEDIPAGRLIWKLDPTLDRLIHKRDIAVQPDSIRQFIDRYAYPYPHDTDYLVVELDNGRFMNHSDQPNTRFEDPDAGFTRSTIAADEELFCNYAEFDPGFEMLPGRVYQAALVATV